MLQCNGGNSCSIKVHLHLCEICNVLGYGQVLFNVLSFRHSPQIALDVPRIVISPHDTARPDAVVHLEHGIPLDTILGLKKLGHDVSVESGIGRSGYFGRGQMIRARRRDAEEEGGERWVSLSGVMERAFGIQGVIFSTNLHPETAI